MKGFQNETIAVIKAGNHNSHKILIVTKPLFIKQIMKVKLLIIRLIMIMRINSNMIMNMSRRMFTRASRLRKASLMITITRKINFMMRLMSTSSVFILPAVIVLRFSIQTRNYINIYGKVACQTLQKRRSCQSLSQFVSRRQCQLLAIDLKSSSPTLSTYSI